MCSWRRSRWRLATSRRGGRRVWIHSKHCGMNRSYQVQNILQDIRYGARMLWKNRLATVVCATALALGIGANTAMFSVAEAFLLHSVPFENPDRIVAMVNVRPQQNIDRNAVA